MVFKTRGVGETAAERRRREQSVCVSRLSSGIRRAVFRTRASNETGTHATGAETCPGLGPGRFPSSLAVPAEFSVVVVYTVHCNREAFVCLFFSKTGSNDFDR